MVKMSRVMFVMKRSRGEGMGMGKVVGYWLFIISIFDRLFIIVPVVIIVVVLLLIDHDPNSLNLY